MLGPARRLPDEGVGMSSSESESPIMNPPADFGFLGAGCEAGFVVCSGSGSAATIWGCWATDSAS